LAASGDSTGCAFSFESTEIVWGTIVEGAVAVGFWSGGSEGACALLASTGGLFDEVEETCGRVEATSGLASSISVVSVPPALKSLNLKTAVGSERSAVPVEEDSAAGLRI